MFALEIAAVSADRLRATCGDDPGWFCHQALDLTGNQTTAEAADFLIGKPLSILLIVIIAVVVNRLARRAVKRTLRGLQAGGIQERLGNVRRFPSR